jgi:hypothetical protein
MLTDAYQWIVWIVRRLGYKDNVIMSLGSDWSLIRGSFLAASVLCRHDLTIRLRVVHVWMRRRAVVLKQRTSGKCSLYWTMVEEVEAVGVDGDANPRKWDRHGSRYPL